MRIETDLDGATVAAIERHYNRAKEKHPYFCDGLTGGDIYGRESRLSQCEYYDAELRLCRDEVRNRSKNGTLKAEHVLQCEYREMLAAMREALELCVKEMCNYCRNEAIARGLELTCVDGCEAYKIAQAALAAPARQCDVGTPEEQGERCLAQFDQWRRKGDGKKLITAIMAWAQMPYTAEEGEGDAI